MPVLVEASPGDEVTYSVTGTHPMYTTILSDSRVLVNTTSMATFRFGEEGNYTYTYNVGTLPLLELCKITQYAT